MKQLSRKLLVILLAISVVLSLCAVSVFAGQQAIGVGTVTGEAARICSGSTESSPVCATLERGTYLSVLGKSGDWYRVNYNSMTGYMDCNSLDYVTSADDLQATGIVSGEGAVVRSAPSLSGRKLCKAAVGTEYDVTGFEKGWYRVNLGEQSGYIRSDVFTLIAKTVEEAPVEDPPAPVEPDTASIIGDAVNLRAAPDTNAAIITALKTGDSLQILETLDGWYKVAYDIHIGYVSADFVSVSNSAEPADDKEAAAKADALPASDTSVIAVGQVTSSGVRMRQEPNTDCDIITTLNEGTAVSVLGQSDGWYEINYGGKDGYISADYLEARSSASNLSAYALVTADMLNMRSEPNASSAKVCGIPEGEYISVSGFDSGWYEASYDDYSGYVSGDFVTLYDSKPEPVRESSGSSSSSSTSLPSGHSAGIGSASPSAIVQYAAQFEGVSYSYGGASPSGFDCSGFVMYVFGHFGYSLPHGASSQLSYGAPVDKSDLQPGDIVFFHDSDDPDPATHVGIFVSGSTFIHASSGSAYSVTYSDLNSSYYSSRFIAARRLG